MGKILCLMIFFWSFGSFCCEKDHTKNNESQQCSYIWTKNHAFPRDQHGADHYFRCITCRSQTWVQWFWGTPQPPAICPNCVETCHQGHYLIKVEYNESYYCSCGAGELKNSCGIMPQEEDKELSIDLKPYLEIFKGLPKKSVMSVIAIEKLFAALEEMNKLNEAKPVFPINKPNLKVYGYGVGYETKEAAAVGIDIKNDVAEIKAQIQKDTGFFDFNLDGASRVLAVIAKSLEEFVVPFDARATDKDFTVYDANNNKKKCEMMRDYQRTGYRFIDDGPIIATELMYKSGGKLVLLMPRDHTENILNFSNEFLEDKIKELLKTTIHDSQKPLFIPKLTIKGSPVSILELLKENFLNRGEALADFDDVQIAGEFRIHEKGTDAIGAAVGRGKGMMDPLVYNHPFLALIIGPSPNNNVLFISYISF